MSNCLFPKCKVAIYARGLCKRHYSLASELVRSGVSTWDAMVTSGKCHGAHSRGRVRNNDVNWFMSNKTVDEKPEQE